MPISSVKFGEDTNGTNTGNYTPSQNPNIGTEVSKKYDGIVVKKSVGGETYTFANHESSRRQGRG